jgi:hypothetical protein
MIRNAPSSRSAGSRVAIASCARAAIVLLGILAACAASKPSDANASAKPKNPAPKGESSGKSEKHAAAAADLAFTDDFGEDVRDLESHGTNPYFSLEPGYVLDLAGEEKGKELRLTITVLPETRTIAGIETRVVEERESLGGELKEVSRNYFAISKRTNNVYYFGEEVDVYKGGKIANHEGAWLHGANGARYGLAMPGTPLLGARFQEESAPGAAMDRGEIVKTNETITVPAGLFTGCLEISETTPLEPGEHETKLYAPRVGLIRDGAAKLVKYGIPKNP